MGQGIQDWPKWNLWKTAFKKFEVHFNFFKGCLPQILIGLFLNTLTQMLLKKSFLNISEVSLCKL